MKYFTMEELDDITKELMENPSRETLKKLNEKYNGEVHTDNDTKWVEASNSAAALEPEQENLTDTKPLENKDDVIRTSQEPFTNNLNNVQSTEMTNDLPKIEVPISNIPFWNPINNTNTTLVNPNNEEKNINQNIENIPSLGTPKLTNLGIQNESLNNSNSMTNETPISTPNANVIPSLEIPKIESFNPNNNSVPFNGNIWEPQQNNVINNMMQTTDNFNKPIEQMPNNQPVVNQNPFFDTGKIPENNPIPVTEPPVMEGPTMFGQFEQNFNNNAA